MRFQALLAALIAVVFGSSFAPYDAGAATTFSAKPATATTKYFAVVDESTVPVAPTGVARPWGLRAAGFDGLSATWTSFVARPDQSVAAGPKGVLQMINGGLVASYDRAGHLQRGWPKDAGQFFGLAKGSPFVDHRAVYDTWTQRYWLTSGDQGSPLIYIAVSQTADPNGKWNVYGFAVTQIPHQLWDFNMFGLDRDTVSTSTHMLMLKGSKVTSLSNAIFVMPKAPMLQGSHNVTGTGFWDIAVDGKFPSSLEPVDAGAQSGAQMPGEAFVAASDTQPCATTPHGRCTQMYVLATSPGGPLALAVVKTPPYSASPLADTPACKRCLETVGPLMSTPAVYQNGEIDFATGTATTDYLSGLPAVFWGSIKPRFSGTRLTSASMAQSGTIAFANGQAAFLPSIMADPAGNLFVMFDASGRALDPSVYVAAHKATDPPGTMSAPRLLKRGTAAPPTHWYSYSWFPYGDYTAASYDPSSGVWFASQYAQSSASYGTYIVNVRL